MTTWADVTNNAIDAAKIIVPASLTAGVAVSIAVFNHLTVRSKERRDRRLAVVEVAFTHLIEHLEATLRFTAFLRRYVKERDQEMIKTLDRKRREEWTRFKDVPPLIHDSVKLRLIGFEGVSDSLTDATNRSEIKALANKVPVIEEDDFNEVAALVKKRYASALSRLQELYSTIETSGFRETIRETLRGF